jgi:hypothetical protein
MKSVTYRLDSEQDFQRIIFSLEESSIPFMARKYSDSSFPSLSQSRGFGDITVPTEYEGPLRSLIETRTNTKPVQVEQSITGKGWKRKSVWQIILITYSVAVSVLCARYWYLNYRTSEDKNNTFEWSFDGQDFITKNKKTRIRTNLHRDANFDQNFEEVVSYSKKGVRLVEWRDLNEDGYYEETFFYNLEGDLTGEQFDRDNDGLVEESTIFIEGQDTLRFFDVNKDGVFELPERRD